MAEMLSERAKLLKRISEADVSGGGNKIRDGAGRLAVKRLTLENKFKGNVFIAEFVVISSRKIPVIALQSKGDIKEGQALDIEPNPPGSECSWVQNFSKHETAFGAVKGFVLNLYNELDASNDDIFATLDEITSEKNSAAGLIVDYETWRKVTDKNKIEMVIPKWSPVEEALAQQAQVQQWIANLAAQQAAAAQPPPHTDADAPRH